MSRCDPPRFGPDNRPSRALLATFERAYVLGRAAGRADMVEVGRSFLEYWRGLVDPALMARVCDDLGAGRALLVLTEDETAAAELWAAIGSYWPPA